MANNSMISGEVAPEKVQERPSGEQRGLGSLLLTFRPALILTVIYCFAFMDRQIFNLLAEPIKHDIGLDDLEIGYLLGVAFIVTYVGFGLPAGWCVDRFNRPRLIAIAGVAWSFGTIAAGFAESYAGLFLSRLFVGASEAFIYPAGMSLLADVYERRRLPVATSMFLIAPALGGGLALVGGGALLDAAHHLQAAQIPFLEERSDWQFALLIVGAAGLLPLPLLMTVRETRDDRDGRGEGADERYGLVEGTGYILRRWRFYLTLFFGMASTILVTGVISAWAPTYLARTFALDPSAIGLRYGSLVLLAGLVAGLASPLVNQFLSRRHRHSTMLTALIAPYMVVLFALAFTLSGTQWLALTSLALLTFSFNFPMSMASTSLQLACPSRLRGVASAYYLVVVNLVGHGLGPVAVPVVAKLLLPDPSAIGPAMAGLAICFGLVSIALLTVAFRNFAREMDVNNSSNRI